MTLLPTLRFAAAAFAALPFLVAAAASAYAQAPPPPQALLTSFLKGEALTESARRQLAESWYDEVFMLRELMPPPGAADAAFLKEEFDDELARNGGEETKRSRAARASPAFKRRETARILFENLNILAILRDPALGAGREMLAWARLGTNWMDRSFNTALIEIAEEAPLLRARLYTDPSRSPEGLIQARQRRGRLIIVTIIVPHLAAQLSQAKR